MLDWSDADWSNGGREGEMLNTSERYVNVTLAQSDAGNIQKRSSGGPN